ncbi:ABC transporter substrate-binding protein [Myceligenerans indicum]|uniref:ABC transporter substrate-binding protein n=1 Tax=Myceligenerans indicum TaxID=2593663 RepID=A0ABS1LI63_9MICO|nr:ABC transporter substrate-binding protein [Myceligenerans indicum]MBL0885513.1 ABC transporter substrate-binding protein [Myceligenerans indicum]
MPHHLRTARGRGALGAATLLVTTALLASCSSGVQGATTLDKDADVTLTWWTGQADQAQTILTGLAEEFEKDHPNVTIEVSSGAPSTEDLLQKLSSSFAGGTYPDISYAFGSWASELADSERTLDITDQVSDPAVGWDEFSGAARQTAQPTGDAVIGFPAVVDNLSLIYNKTVFDAAGIDHPTADWTWDDFRTAAAELADPDTSTYGYGYSVSGSEETTWQFWPHLWQNGGEILDDSGTEATFDSQAGIDALTLLRDMAVEDKSVYLDQTDTKFGQIFASDQIGMITSGPWSLYDLQVAGTDYGVVPLPGTDGRHTTISGADLWVLFDHQDANREYWSYEFTRWLTDPEQDLRWNVAYGNLPLRESEIDSPEFQEQVTQMPGLDVMAENSANATIPRPTVPGYVNLSEAIGTAISEVLQGEGDPGEALSRAADEATASLAEK